MGRAVGALRAIQIPISCVRQHNSPIHCKALNVGRSWSKKSRKRASAIIELTIRIVIKIHFLLFVSSVNIVMDIGDGSVRLTLEDVRELITKDEPDVEIINLDEEPGSGRGDNYTSMLYRVQAKGRKKLKNDEWIKYECAIIYKILPESKKHREAFKSELLFRNEVAFYKYVWPVLDRLQSNDRRVFGGVPKIYAARADLIAMEDLRERGFKMADRRKGLEVENLKLVLKALAGFHALSLTLKDSR